MSIVTGRIVVWDDEGVQVNLPSKSSSFTEKVAGKTITVAQSASDYDIFPGTMTSIDVLVIYADGALTYKMNSSSTAQTFDDEGQFYLHGTNVTALTVSEAGTANVKLKMWAWGA